MDLFLTLIQFDGFSTGEIIGLIIGSSICAIMRIPLVFGIYCAFQYGFGGFIIGFLLCSIESAYLLRKQLESQMEEMYK